MRHTDFWYALDILDACRQIAATHGDCHCLPCRAAEGDDEAFDRLVAGCRAADAITRLTTSPQQREAQR